MRTFVRLALLGLVTAATACGDKDPGEPISIAGTYQLQSVNGQSPPVTVAEDPGFKVEVLSGNFILAGNGNFTTTVDFRFTVSGEVTTDSDTYPGTYSVSGSTVTFKYDDGDTETATISGNTLTFNSDGTIVVFRR